MTGGGGSDNDRGGVCGHGGETKGNSRNGVEGRVVYDLWQPVLDPPNDTLNSVPSSHCE